MDKKKVKAVTNLYKENLQKLPIILNKPLGNVNNETPIENINNKELGNVYESISITKPLLGGNVNNKPEVLPQTTTDLLKNINKPPTTINKPTSLDTIPMTVYTYTVPSDIGNVYTTEPRVIKQLTKDDNVNNVVKHITDSIIDDNVNTESSDNSEKINEIKKYNLNQDLNVNNQDPTDLEM